MKLLNILGVPLAATMLMGQDAKPLVYVIDSDSWTLGEQAGARAGAGAATGAAIGAATGGGGGAAIGAITGGIAGAANTSGGARPQTVEIMKNFHKDCQQVDVTINREQADFVVILEHEGGKGFMRKDNKVAVFNKEGIMIYGDSTRSLGNAVKDACKVILDEVAGDTAPVKD